MKGEWIHTSLVKGEWIHINLMIEVDTHYTSLQIGVDTDMFRDRGGYTHV